MTNSANGLVSYTRRAGGQRRSARLLLAVGTLGALAFAGAEADAQLYPPCNPVACAMIDMPGSMQVMTGTAPGNDTQGEVNVYIIFYGPFSDAYGQVIKREGPNVIAAVSGSAYQATAWTYGASGEFRIKGYYFDNGSLGSTLSTSVAETEIANVASQWGGLDPNGIYVIFADTSIYLPSDASGSFCTDWCAYNTTATISGQAAHYAVIGSAIFCPGKECSWNTPGPHDWITPQINTNGKVDFELAAVVHELNEIITDPNMENGGWYNFANPGITQMADFCQYYGADGYSYPVNGTLVSANFHGANEDFLLQELRVNVPVGGNGGYCAPDYGGVFWGRNFGYGWSPIGDWISGSYKGECEPGQALTGLSAYASGQGQAHAVRCNVNHGNTSLYTQNQCEAVWFDGQGSGPNNNQLYSDPAPVGDWDYGYYKAECRQNEYVAGIAQSTTGKVDGLLCCPTSVGHRSCVAEPLNSGNLSSFDWDANYYKAECTPGQYVAGVSASTSNGAPHEILCCSP